MNLNDLKEMAKRDVSIDRNDIVSATVETPMLIHKYLDLFTANAKSLLNARRDLAIKKQEKMLFYKTEYKLKPETAKEMQMLLEGDEELAGMNANIEMRETIIKFIEETIRTLRNRPYEIKNIIEWQKFTHGG